jgi:translation elongation factor P/translation initiation factor 5A
MAKIIKILHFRDKEDYALVDVLLDDGTEAQIYIGGNCEVFFHKGQVKAFVKKAKDNA